VAVCSCNSGKEKKAGSTISSNGVDIAYTKCGNSDTALVFLHGWCINKEYWENQVRFFCPRYTVVTIDLPGFGQSGKERENWSFEAYTEDVKKVINDLNLKKVILIGHSMSGDIILHMDNKYPGMLAGIVGIDNLHQPVEVFDAQRNKENDAFFKTLQARFDSTVKLFMTDFLFQPSTDTTIIRRVMNDVYNADSTAATAVLRSNTIISQKEKPMMMGLSHRLYLVNSDVHPINADSLNKYCKKGFHAELIPGTGHYPMLEKPELFNAALQRVVDSISVRR
jgi:pimeloyl-ACP methyl ester carboxylesterase